MEKFYYLQRVFTDGLSEHAEDSDPLVESRRSALISLLEQRSMASGRHERHEVAWPTAMTIAEATRTELRI